MKRKKSQIIFTSTLDFNVFIEQKPNNAKFKFIPEHFNVFRSIMSKQHGSNTRSGHTDQKLVSQERNGAGTKQNLKQ